MNELQLYPKQDKNCFTLINNYRKMILTKNQDFATLDTLVKIAKEQGFNNLEDAQTYFNNK